MTRTPLIAAAAALTLAAAMPATGATVQTVADGGVVCDSFNNLSAATKANCSSNANFDFGQSAGAGDALTFEGSGTLFGFVRDRSGTSNRYADAVTITLEKAATLTFSIFNTDPIFKGTLEFTGQVFANPVFDVNNTTVAFSVDAGTYVFDFDATKPNETQDNTTEYALSVSAVPLPASSLLLLAGVGGIAAMRRRKKS